MKRLFNCLGISMIVALAMPSADLYAKKTKEQKRLERELRKEEKKNLKAMKRDGAKQSDGYENGEYNAGQDERWYPEGQKPYPH